MDDYQKIIENYYIKNTEKEFMQIASWNDVRHWKDRKNLIILHSMVLSGNIPFLYSYSSCQNDMVSIRFALPSIWAPIRSGWSKYESISPSERWINFSLLDADSFSVFEFHTSILIVAVLGILPEVYVLSTAYEYLFFSVGVFITRCPLTKRTMCESQPE